MRRFTFSVAAVLALFSAMPAYAAIEGKCGVEVFDKQEDDFVEIVDFEMKKDAKGEYAFDQVVSGVHLKGKLSPKEQGTLTLAALDGEKPILKDTRSFDKTKAKGVVEVTKDEKELSVWCR